MTTANASASILIVDDNASARESIEMTLQHAGYRTNSCSSGKECLRLHDADVQPFDLIITDLMMPGMTGLELMQSLQQRQVPSQVLMVTAHATIETAVDAMKFGAFDFIEKPFNAEQLESLVGRALQSREVPQTIAPSSACMVGSSKKMSHLRQQIQQVAPTDVTVLIQGESGTGKELVARQLHLESLRGAGPLVSVNCPAMSPQLMESELFGHQRGAFTNADQQREGRFELADGGTLFLDEVTEIELGLQSKLLRVLQEKCFERVGCSKTIHVDVRLVAATNRRLSEAVANGQFREDLYFRLAVVPLEIPPLRERAEDVSELIEHFLGKTAERLGKPRKEFSAGAIERCVEYHWPGNVRELENLVTRMCVLRPEDKIGPDALSELLAKPADDGGELEELTVGMSLQEMERQLIEQTLDHYDGHRERTAKALGIGVRTLANKLKSYGYEPRAKSARAA